MKTFHTFPHTLNKGFLKPLLIIIVTLFVVGVGYFIVTLSKHHLPIVSSSTTTIVATTTVSVPSNSSTTIDNNHTTNPPVSTLDSGIHGNVKIGPICPVVPYPDNGHCAPKPYAATLFIKNTKGIHLKTIMVGSDGLFSIALPAGNYTITDQHSSGFILPRLAPVSCSVLPHHYTSVNIEFDSGIR